MYLIALFFDRVRTLLLEPWLANETFIVSPRTIQQVRKGRLLGTEATDPHFGIRRKRCGIVDLLQLGILYI